MKRMKNSGCGICSRRCARLLRRRRSRRAPCARRGTGSWRASRSPRAELPHLGRTARRRSSAARAVSLLNPRVEPERMSAERFFAMRATSSQQNASGRLPRSSEILPSYWRPAGTRRATVENTIRAGVQSGCKSSFTQHHVPHGAGARAGAAWQPAPVTTTVRGNVFLRSRHDRFRARPTCRRTARNCTPGSTPTARRWRLRHDPPGTLDEHVAQMQRVKASLFDGGWMQLGWPGVSADAAARRCCAPSSARRSRRATGRRRPVHAARGAGADAGRLRAAGARGGRRSRLLSGRAVVPGLLRARLGQRPRVAARCHRSAGGRRRGARDALASTDRRCGPISRAVRRPLRAAGADRGRRSRHRGISAFFVDMDTPGITVRPLEMMNGDLEFAEVFFGASSSPAGASCSAAAERLWLVGRDGILPYRRSSCFWQRIARTSPAARALVGTAGGPVRAAEIVGGVSAAAPAAAPLARDAAPARRDRHDRRGTSIDKVLVASAEQSLYDAGSSCRDDRDRGRRRAAEWRSQYLFSRAATIYGGTAEVQHIIARRLLDLRATGETTRCRDGWRRRARSARHHARGCGRSSSRRRGRSPRGARLARDARRACMNDALAIVCSAGARCGERGVVGARRRCSRRRSAWHRDTDLASAANVRRVGRAGRARRGSGATVSTDSRLRASSRPRRCWSYCDGEDSPQAVIVPENAAATSDHS